MTKSRRGKPNGLVIPETISLAVLETAPPRGANLGATSEAWLEASA